MKWIAFAVGGLVSSLIACSGSKETPLEYGSDFRCCINGASFDCNSQEAFSHCGKSDVEQFCPRDVPGDAFCTRK